MVYVFASIVLFFGFLFWGIEKMSKPAEHADTETNYLTTENSKNLKQQKI